MRDVRAIVTERGAGCDGTLRRQVIFTGRNAQLAYGEVVWSWRRDPGVKLRRVLRRGDGGKRGRSPGRARRKPSNHCAGKAGMSRLYL